MLTISLKTLAGSILAALVLFAAASPPAVAQQGQPSAARTAMQRCVLGVVTRLSRAKASEDVVGPTVLSECGDELRAVLESAIRSGEAGECTIQSCLEQARVRTAAEATAAYRERNR